MSQDSCRYLKAVFKADHEKKVPTLKKEKNFRTPMGPGQVDKIKVKTHNSAIISTIRFVFKELIC